LQTTPVVKALEGHTFTDNMKNSPTHIRAWDHQFVQEVYIARMKTGAALKKDRNDFYEVFGVMQGEDIVTSREENPCELEPYQ